MRWRDALVTLLGAVALNAAAAGQMPDPRQMSGIAIASPELPDGTVTVRVVRGQLTNNLEGVSVELQGAGDVRVEKTGANGRATFSGLPPGATVRARAVVNGETLESSSFQVPPTGGVRTLLAASPEGPARPDAPSAGGDGAGAGTPPARSSDAVAGAPVSLTPNSRIAIEFANDVLQVFYLLEIANRSGSPMPLESPLVFALPQGALGATVMEGSTRQAVAERDRVLLTGPLPAGTTELQIAFRLQPSGSTLELRQEFPLPVDMVLLAVQKVGGMQVSSPQITRVQDAPIQNTLFIVGSGPALPAGHPLIVTVTGMPHHSRAGLWLALALVAAVVAGGAWLAAGPGAAAARQQRRRALEAERDRGLAALAALDDERRRGLVDAETGERRRTEMTARLERIYAELESGAVAPIDRGAAA